MLALNSSATVDNTGTITGAGGTFDVGVGLIAGGSVDNSGTSALIMSRGYAVFINGAAGTVTNQGTLTGGAAAGQWGIGLTDGGTVNNTGLVYGNTGIYVYGAAVTVTNSGTIDGAGVAGVAVQTYAGGTITNDGLIYGTGYGIQSFNTNAFTVVNQGTIAGGVYGVALEAGGTVGNTGLITGAAGIVALASATVDNAGTITATGPLGTGGGVSTLGLLAPITGIQTDGVNLLGGGSLTNSGSIGGYNGVLALNSSATVDNTGTITGAGGTFDVGVGLIAGGSVDNSGTSALIMSRGYAVFINGAAGTVTNQGTLTGGAAAGQWGIGLTDGGTVNNTGLVYGNTGIYVYGAAVTVTNSGTIDGAGVAGVAVQTYAGGTITNDGLIYGTGYGIQSFNTNAFTVVNQGTIAGGTYALQAMYGIALNVEAGAVFAGAVVDLSNTGDLNLIGTSSGSLNMGGSFAGFAQISFGSAAWTLAGNIAELAAGETIAGFARGDVLDVESFAATAGDVTVASDGLLTLSGSGGTEVLNLTTAAAGTVLTVTSDGASGVDVSVDPHILNTSLATGITLTTNGAYQSAFTVTQYGAVTSGATGVYSALSGAYLLNQGNIGATSHGVSLVNGGTVVNEGTVTGADGVVIVGARGVVTNDGLIRATGTPGKGVWLKSGGTVSNAAGGTITSTGVGAFVYGGGSVANMGTIAGNLGVYSSAAQVTNSGLISGTTGIQVINGTIFNSGTIAGSSVAVILGGSTADRLVMETGGLVQGVIERGSIAKATLSTTVELAASSGTLGGVGSTVTGMNTFAFDPGAAWTVSGTAAGFNGDTVTGFAAGDTLVIDGFTASSHTDTNGTLVLSEGTTSTTLDITGGLTVTESAGNTDITVICYLRGTRILTPAGEIPVECLNIGDAVITRFGGYRPIKWIGRQSYANRFVHNNRDQIPVCITAGSLGRGLPKRDLFVSPGHSMLLNDELVLARDLVNGITITQTDAPEEIHYYQIEFETHDCVVAEGAWSESYAEVPGYRAKFHNAAEFYALYPDHEEPLALTLCAPRPLAGPQLETHLHPLVSRAAALRKPGALHGYVDEIAPAGLICGWAWDEANPELPVWLEIVSGGRVIGTVLAREYRGDLKDAGFAQGKCAFRYNAPLGLPSDPAQNVKLRRAQDGVEIQMTGQCLAQLGEAPAKAKRKGRAA